MKIFNVIWGKDETVLCFYGIPTEKEKSFGTKLLSYLASKKHPVYNATKKHGYMQVGSSYSNIKLASKKSATDKRNEIIETLYHERHGLNYIELLFEVSGSVYRTFAFSKDDMRILFEK